MPASNGTKQVIGGRQTKFVPVSSVMIQRVSASDCMSHLTEDFYETTQNDAVEFEMPEVVPTTAGVVNSGRCRLGEEPLRE